ncbi:MAG: flagellar motor protein MotB [Zetaproteobacteria bacterium CG12_big_fil_rev_8_21_14_0_65_55_1124]|nr:MAG: flagellar motor protein MotB [Zetaproteobacteria bacterium CG1_02_55_237]PIS18874.1 MAG: flagellar motor protein MotB [Zetaproteobacteria bacterium CG08_land_8_20_14_0_20_55_17]PIW44002.1 MAG: flagellar motor protein MotB [Zetaproteobacteria bacterium CG12_big_fil_rev_8_21_14_0_65_55_1124]PIY51506.1 MAG: flagellar motor protein MotB [Zetaproteobacteria bacterium CG_4_10_14_0_8_um_filter_55_43]PIZ40204.1 MAG: flagellar motor protein MotB [Zetaproteobacteria bacterium CG_4_10_14_0_2_um_fi
MHAMMRYGFSMVLVMSLAACATTPNDPNAQTKEKAAMGAAAGAVLGAVIGYQGDHSGGALRGALVGAAAGGVLGAGVGAYMDKQQAEFERKLASEQQAHQVEIERLQNESLKITMNSEVSFDFGSAQVTPSFGKTLDKVGDILQRYNRSGVTVVGHTDDVGSAEFNQNLSLQRADSVAYYLEDRGVDRQRIRTEGRGESEPRASNASEAGRQLNRRVELIIKPDSNIQ